MSTTYRVVTVERYVVLCDSRSEDGKSGGSALVGEYDSEATAERVRAAMEAMDKAAEAGMTAEGSE